MKRFRVKVCGLTRPEDARLATQLGADMVGMIFYRRSPRFLTQQKAARLMAAIPPTVARVGVFVDATTEQMLRVAQRLKLDYIQLHGSEPASQITVIQRAGFKVIKAFTVGQSSDYDLIRGSRADLVMVDARTDTLPGGTGKRFDWSLRPKRKLPNLVLAGGINSENIATGVEIFQPLVVDVNSGVESKPGLKSPVKLKRFFRQCDKLRYGTKL